MQHALHLLMMVEFMRFRELNSSAQLRLRAARPQ
jgi:hypothetical protein